MWADRWADADDEPMDEPKRAKLKPISENGRQLNTVKDFTKNALSL
jgi:hypothetical protein